VAGALTSLLWQALRGRLAAPWNGIHGFIVGVTIALLVIVIGTFLARPAPSENIRRAWGE